MRFKDILFKKLTTLFQSKSTPQNPPAVEISVVPESPKRSIYDFSDLSALTVSQFPILRHYEGPTEGQMRRSLQDAKTGEPEALFKFAMDLWGLRSLYLTGVDGEEGDTANKTADKQGVLLCIMAADKGHLRASAMAGYFHATGQHVSLDKELALKYLKPPAETGDKDAQDIIGRLDKIPPYQEPTVRRMVLSKPGVTTEIKY